jgi:pimeloyl-ACP methyl ester carboxylesterase
MEAVVQISEHMVSVRGGRMYAKRWQPKQPALDVPVVLLHDSLGCVELWRDFPEALCNATGRAVVAYDRLGFGRSDRRSELPSNRFISEEAEIYLPALLDALALENVVLCGHSVGGGMAIIAAGCLTSRCAAVISESAQAFVEPRTRQGILRAQSEFKDPRAFVKLQQYHGEKAEWVLRAWTDTWLSDAFTGWSLSAELPQMRCPSLVIHGDSDEYGSTAFPETIARLAGGPCQMHVLTGVGHVPHRSHKEVVLRLISDFLSREPQRI